MQSNDVIEIVTPPSGRISEVTVFPDAAAVPAGPAGVLVEQGRIFHAAVRHLSSFESEVALSVGRVEIPVIGRDGEIAGVLCRDLPLASASRSTPLARDQDTVFIDKATEAQAAGHSIRYSLIDRAMPRSSSTFSTTSATIRHSIPDGECPPFSGSSAARI